MKLLKHIIYVGYRFGMQFERFYSLKQSAMAWFAHLHHLSNFRGKVCGGNGGSVQPYAYPQ